MKRRRAEGPKSIELGIASAGASWLIPGCTEVTNVDGKDDYCRAVAVAFGFTISHGNRLEIKFFCEEHWK